MLNNIILLIIVLIIGTTLYISYFKKNEHLTSGSLSTLSNEAIQTMGSVLNTGNGTVTNLNVLGKLTIGKTTINSDGSINVGKTTIDSNGNISWQGDKVTWTMRPEGDVMVLRNMTPANDSNGVPVDSRFAFIGDGFMDFGLTTSTKGTITTKGDVIVGNNVVLDGTNKWILYTPDNGDKNLYIAPRGADDWLLSNGMILRN